MSDATVSKPGPVSRPGAAPGGKPSARPPVVAAAAPARRKRAESPRARRTLGAVARVVALYAALGLVAVVLAAATFLVIANPAQVIGDRLAAQVKARTGHSLVAKGGASLTLFPALGVVLHDVALSQPSSGPVPPPLAAEAATARIAWRPLLAGRVVVRTASLTRPVLTIAVGADGQSNWDFAALESPASPRRIRLAQATPRFGQGVSRDLVEALERSVGQAGRGTANGTPAEPLPQELSMSDGRIRYSDARSGVEREVSGVTLRLSGNVKGAVAIAGSFAWAGEQVAISGEVEPAAAGEKALAVRAKARPFEASWSGRVALREDMAELDGRLSARAPSVLALARWMAQEAAGEAGQDSVAVDGRLRVAGTSAELSGATIAWNGMSATGAVSVEAARQRPLIRAQLEVPELAFDRREPKAGAERATSSPSRSAGDGINDLLRRGDDPEPKPKAQARSFAQRSGGAAGEKPLQLALLSHADVDATLAIGRLSWRHLEMAAARVRVAVADGRFRADVEEAQLYGGRGKGALTVHTENAIPVVGLAATLEDVTALPLLQDAAGFDWVDGRGRVSVDLTSRGASEQELLDHLGGRASFKVTDGAVIGWNVTHMLRKLRQGQMSALERDPLTRTAFSELAGSFTLAGGVASNQDLKMTSEAIQLTGAGRIGLAQRSVDYTVRPRLAVAAAQAGSNAEPLSVEVPVRIHGAWANPVFAPDLQAALNDPRTQQTVQQIGRQLRSGKVEDAVKSFFGDGPEADAKAAKAKELLQKFLKQ